MPQIRRSMSASDRFESVERYGGQHRDRDDQCSAYRCVGGNPRRRPECEARVLFQKLLCNRSIRSPTLRNSEYVRGILVQRSYPTSTDRGSLGFLQRWAPLLGRYWPYPMRLLSTAPRPTSGL